MTNKIINHLIYSSIFVSIVSSFLSLATPLVFDIKISANKALLVFFGTLLIYNVDHLKDIKSDKTTNPERADFIDKNKKYLLFLISLSVAVSIYLLLKIDFEKTLILIPIFIIGISHWKLKDNSVVSTIYITLSWTVVVTIFPLIGELYSTNSMYITSIIFGLTFMANASVFVASEHESIVLNKTILFAKSLTLFGLILVFSLGSETRPFIFIPGLTLFALFFYKPTERYNLFFMDGALLLGGIMSILYKQFFSFL